MDRGWLPAAILILLSSLLAVVYVWRVIEIVWFREPPSDVELKDAPLSLLLPTWILIGATVFFGLYTEVTVEVASDAAKLLLGVAP